MESLPANPTNPPEMNLRWMRGVRNIAAIDALLVTGLIAGFIAMNDREEAPLAIIFLPFLALYAGILWCLRAGPSRRGLRLAMLTGVAVAVLLSAITLFVLVIVIFVLIMEPLEGEKAKTLAILTGLSAGFALLAWMQWAMYQNAKKAHETQWPEIKLAHRTRWIWALFAVVCTGTLFVLAVAVPGLLRSRIAANEASAVGSLRSIRTAAENYRKEYQNGFPRDLKTLGQAPGGTADGCRAADLITGALASGKKNGYIYVYTPGPALKEPVAGCPPGVESYTVGARPREMSKSGQRNFFVDESGVIRATTQDRAATKEDRRIDQ